MLFANVTRLSKLIMDYLKAAGARDHCIGMAKHKKARENSETSQKACVESGFKSWWTQARRTEKGISGGTYLHHTRYFTAHRIDWAALPEGQVLQVDPAICKGIVVQAAINVVVVAAYFEDGIGMKMIMFRC